jgi:hypothetical protein
MGNWDKSIQNYADSGLRRKRSYAREGFTKSKELLGNGEISSPPARKLPAPLLSSPHSLDYRPRT